MVRGTQKQVIHLKNPESPLFEEAIFVMKHMPHTPLSQRTMVEEANRLLSGEGIGDTPAEQKEDVRTPFLALFFLGAVVGATVTALLMTLL